MHGERQKLFSLAAVVVAAVLFGMVIAGVLNVTPAVDADRPAAGPVTISSPAAPDFATLAERVVPAVVSVNTEEVTTRRQMPRDPFHFFFRGPQRDDELEQEQVRRGSGSGFFISADGEILTNNHVIEDADSITVELDDDTRFAAEVIGRDPATDIALIKVKDADRSFPYLALGDSDAVRVGEWVMAVGNPLNMDHTVTVGVVSAKDRVLGLSDDGRSFESFIQTDAAINFGNSGGPLLNLGAQVIGINTAINAAGDNLGFATPTNIAKRILPQLRERGRVVRGYLGITVSNVTEEVAEAFGLSKRNGALVEEVIPDHAADKGGVRPGDVIVELDGDPIDDTRDLIDSVSAMPPGTKVKLDIIRDGKRTALTVELEERAGPDDEAADDDGPRGEDQAAARVGITVTPLTPRYRQYYDLDDDTTGVVVTRVRPLSPAAEAGLVRDDVILEANGRQVGSVDELLAAIDRVEAGGLLRLYVHRPRAERSFFAILRLDE